MTKEQRTASKERREKGKHKRHMSKERESPLTARTARRRPRRRQGATHRAGFPAGRQLLEVDKICFTQSHAFDSFSTGKSTTELINGLLAGQITERGEPLIRVAWHEGAFWPIDNRRLFVYKHCRL